MQTLGDYMRTVHEPLSSAPTTRTLHPPTQSTECGSCTENISGSMMVQREVHEIQSMQTTRPQQHQEALSRGSTCTLCKDQSRAMNMPSYPLMKTYNLPNEREQHLQQPSHNTTAMRQHTKLRSSTYLLLLLSIVIIQLLISTTPVTAQEDEPVVNNPANKFCGINYNEAHQFCHLPPHKSLPCPNGEDDCPYNMPCWEILEDCTAPPSLGPTVVPSISPVVAPSGSPMTRRSGEPGDHNFCGLGFTNLFGCAINCPNGSPVECPSGQLCYFDTPCDARIEGILLGEPSKKPTPMPTQRPTISHAPVDYVDSGVPDGRYNFCGTSVMDAVKSCHRDRHCPSGNNEECPEEMFCYVNVKGCNIKELPSMKPTISPKPTPYPSFSPTTRDPSYTYAPTNSPLDKDDIRSFFFCGTSWGDATARCYRRCLSGSHAECPGDEECFAQAGCMNGLIEEKPPAPSPDDETQSNNSISPDGSLYPTPIAVDTPEPTQSPLEKDDYRNFFFCGTSWGDASDRCYKRCVTGRHIECPGEDECFAQAACKKGVIEPKTVKPTIEPTAMPFDGTRSPTISPEPTNFPTEPQPTMAPLPLPTLSPALHPTESPTTPFPTNRPTYAPCAGEPCSNKEHCRSNQNFCGPGKYYCNERSIWEASCGVPTDPPVSAAPTTIWPSMSPSVSSIPTRFKTKSPTGRPSQLSDVIYYLKTDPPTNEKITNRPSVGSNNNEEEDTIETSPPTYGNVDDKYYAPGDPLGTFFCGTDWNHAIAECPHRCPSGEASQCPNGWACYAFTPCVGLGRNTPPTTKPTWEPTKRPTPKPTRGSTPMPTTTRQSWAQQNSELNAQNVPNTQNTQKPVPTPKPVWWTPAPSPKPSYSPTEDQCRGVPCDYEGECRSRLGFCGTGIVYCNSASSWVPSCGGGGASIRLDEDTTSPNTLPTAAPSNAWDVWVQSKDDNPDNTIVVSEADDNDSSQNSNEDATGKDDTADDSTAEEEEEEEEDTPANSGYNPDHPDAWTANWDSRADAEETNEDMRWWAQRISSTTRTHSLLMTPVLCALFFYWFVVIS